MMKKNNGSVLAIVLISISIMLLMIYVLAQLTTSQQKSSSNYMDMKLAENNARIALLQAESQAYWFDFNNNLESMQDINTPNVKNCDLAVNDLKTVFTDIGNDFSKLKNIANCENIRRAWEINKRSPTFFKSGNGEKCNQGNDNVGVCYKRVADKDYTFDSDYSWRPWESGVPSTYSTTSFAPCNTFTGDITLLDASDKNGKPIFARDVDVYNYSVCANPRFIIEPINLDFRGRYIDSYYESDGVAQVRFESDLFIQRNSATMRMYKINVESNTIYGSSLERSPAINSTRLYRITAKGYGRNGDSRAILQEIIMIDGYTNDSYAYSTESSLNQRVKWNDDPKNLAYRIVRVSLRWIKP